MKFSISLNRRVFVMSLTNQIARNVYKDEKLELLTLKALKKFVIDVITDIVIFQTKSDLTFYVNCLLI